MTLWRISNHRSLGGEGGLRASGRWHTRGRRIVYTAESPAAALLEILVHLEIGTEDLPVRYRLLRVDAPDDLRVEHVAVSELPLDWRTHIETTREIGDTWLAAGLTPFLVVPSALVPDTRNVLLNPGHSETRRVRVVSVSEHLLDPRFFT